MNELNQTQAFRLLFKTIIEQNAYYESIKKEHEKVGRDIISIQLADDYVENVDFISVYKYLDSVENIMRSHHMNVGDALEYLWELGTMWEE